MKVMIINHYCCTNRGDTSILNSMFEALVEVFPDARFFIASQCPEIDSKLIKAKIVRSISVPSPGLFLKLKTIIGIIRCTLWAVFYRLFKINLNLLIQADLKNTIEAYSGADIVIARGNDCLTDVYGATTFLTAIFEILLTVLLGKPVMIYAQSIGPIKNDLRGRIFKLLLKLVLNRVNLITVRDEISKTFLQALGINKPSIYVTADSAFLLRPVPYKRIKEILSEEELDKQGNGLLLGISTSQIIYRYGFPGIKSMKEKYHKYVKLMAKLADYLVEELGATVILVPHALGPGLDDDRLAANAIYRVIRNKPKVKVITKEYTPEELRGLVGQFELFIATRMHALIHAISMNIPSIGIDYNYKVRGLLKMIELEKFVCDMNQLNFNDLKFKIIAAYSNIDEIRSKLAPKVDILRKRAMLNAKLVKNLVYPQKEM